MASCAIAREASGKTFWNGCERRVACCPSFKAHLYQRIRESLLSTGAKTCIRPWGLNEPLEVFSHTKGNPGAAAGASSADSDQYSLARMMLGYAMRLLDWPGSLRNVVRARTGEPLQLGREHALSVSQSARGRRLPRWQGGVVMAAGVSTTCCAFELREPNAL